ncbi:efflux RND transporter periplasmic adaptor subunit [Massilia solisilvae]|uniref:Efflux RND transporter periplasmic adaptor subunit n=1 Tax=Massilia solisilvae TaxID=1811225 RepID=A0ABT2BQM7_9BURK|nr:efflux RND transporter periplasmic adaptor subunit [Massilia solisilvae]MCS0610811.1 efflux RND transporter periplasmic adaptor subunit [Massilia solisilvae]
MIRDTSAQDAVIASHPASKFKKRAFVIGGAIALAAVGAMLLSAYRSSDETVNAARIRIAEVGRGTLVRDAAVNGRVVAAVSPTLFSTASATVSLKVQAGDTVKKGQVLAVLTSPDLADALKREQTAYEQLQAEVARQEILSRKQKLLAQKEADTAEIERLSAQRTLERYQSVANEGVIAKIDYQKAKDALNSAEIRARHAASAAALEKDDVALALKTKTSQLQTQKLSLAEAQRRVDELTVRAPVDGFIGTLNVQDRAVVPANAPLMTLVDLSRLEVEVEVPETFAADLGIGMNAEITIGNATVKGKLSALSPEVVKNIVLARVRFEGKQPEGLRQSQRVSARLLIEEKPNVVMVARGPFVESEGGRFAYLVKDGIAVRTPVQIGATSISSVEILSGARPGDKIVISGTDTFKNAQRVAINN